MPKVRIIDAAMFILDNFSEEEITRLKKMNIINNRIVLAIEVKKCYDNQTAADKRTRYEHTAEDMKLSERYVRRLLNE